MMPLLSIYIACLTIAVIMRDASKAATASALLVNWLANTGMVTMTGDTYPWLAFIVVDYLTALAIFGWTVSRWQATIIAIYAVELLCHVGFGISAQGPWPRYYGWWALYYMAITQILMFGGWVASDMVGYFVRHRRGKASRRFGFSKDRPS